jgi:hypothetical protein
LEVTAYDECSTENNVAIVVDPDCFVGTFWIAPVCSGIFKSWGNPREDHDNEERRRSSETADR